MCVCCTCCIYPFILLFYFFLFPPSHQQQNCLPFFFNVLFFHSSLAPLFIGSRCYSSCCCCMLPPLFPFIINGGNIRELFLSLHRGTSHVAAAAMHTVYHSKGRKGGRKWVEEMVFTPWKQKKNGERDRKMRK